MLNYREHENQTYQVYTSSYLCRYVVDHMVHRHEKLRSQKLKICSFISCLTLAKRDLSWIILKYPEFWKSWLIILIWQCKSSYFSILHFKIGFSDKKWNYFLTVAAGQWTLKKCGTQLKYLNSCWHFFINLFKSMKEMGFHKEMDFLEKNLFFTILQQILGFKNR